MLAVEPARLSDQQVYRRYPSAGNVPCDNSGNKELRAVGIFSRVGHTQETGFAMLQLEVLVGKFRAVNRFPTSACYLVQQ